MNNLLKEAAGVAVTLSTVLSWRGTVIIIVIIVAIYALLGDATRCDRLTTLIKAWRAK
jgi:hypothetical protein